MLHHQEQIQGQKSFEEKPLATIQMGTLKKNMM